MPPLVLGLKNKIDKFLTNLIFKTEWGTEGEREREKGERGREGNIKFKKPKGNKTIDKQAT